jgi:hypothetical protein
LQLVIIIVKQSIVEEIHIKEIMIFKQKKWKPYKPHLPQMGKSKVLMGGELFYFNQDWIVKTSTLVTSLFTCIVHSLYHVISASSLLQCRKHHNQNLNDNLEHYKLLKHTKTRLQL